MSPSQPKPSEAAPGVNVRSNRTRTPRSSVVRDLIVSLLLCLACVLVGGLVTLWFKSDADWGNWILAALLSLAVAGPNIYLMHSPWIHTYPAAAPLLATMWRMGSYMAIVLMRDATNWPQDNFFLTCLQGCYFPSLLLESSLFINQVRD